MAWDLTPKLVAFGLNNKSCRKKQTNNKPNYKLGNSGKPRAIWQWLARDKRVHANYFRSAARSCRSQTILAKYLAH